MPKVVLFLLLILTSTGLGAQAGDQWACGGGCQVKRPTDQDVEDLLRDFYTGQLNRLTVRLAANEGAFVATLPDESLLVLRPVGLAFQHQSSGQRQSSQLTDGSYRLRSQDGLSMRLRSAFYNEVETIGELSRLGWDNFVWTEQGIEMDSPQGERMCFNPDMEVFAAPATGTTEISVDSDNHLVIAYQDGIQQRLHACPHDLAQLRDQIRSAVQQELRFNVDGTFGLDIDGRRLRFRLTAMLQPSETIDQPGFFTIQNRIYFRYRDGWVQEIVELSQN